MQNLSPTDATTSHPLTTSAPSSPRLSPSDAHHAGIPNRAVSAVSEFDVLSYLNDEELYSNSEQRIQQQHVYSSSSSSSSSFNFVPQQAGQSTSIRRRGSSRSSVLSAVNIHQDDLHDAGIHANHRRDVSSSSAADIGLGRGLHTRHSSYAPVSPTYDPIDYPRSTGDGQQPMRPASTAAWSQISLDDLQHQRDLHDQAGLYDSPTQANSGWEDGAPIASTSYGSGYPPDLEIASGSDSRADRDRKSTSRKSKAKSALYKRNADADGQGLGRRRTMMDNAKRELKRMSVRVVNIKQRDETRHVRMADHVDSDEEDPDLLASEPVLLTAGAQDYPPRRGAPPDPGIAHYSGGTHSTFDQAGEALQGRTLCLFGSESKIRRAAAAVFLWSWTEPLILLLIIANVVVLTIQSAPSVYKHPRPARAGYFYTWEDYALFILFVAFTLESLARILVSGFILSPKMTLFAYIENMWHKLKTSTSKGASNSQKAVLFPHMGPNAKPKTSSNQHILLHGHSKVSSYSVSASKPADEATSASSVKRTDSASDLYPPLQSAPSTIKSFRSTANLLSTQSPSGFRRMLNKSATFHEDVPFVRAMQNAREQRLTDQKAYLRHSWNRVDFLAIASFWIMFILAITGVEAKESVYIFRALSVLRAARLLTITAGTTTILRSLKQSAPLMANVAFFVIFAMVLFSIIGVQAFKGSWRRSCVWMDPDGQDDVPLGQLCGGHVNQTTGQISSFIKAGTSIPVLEAAKGFICPLGQLCMEGQNPSNNLQSFDNILASLLQIVVVTGSNTWSNTMYAMVDAEYMVSSLFFIFCLILLNFWLANIFVAVIVDTFGNIREETKQSAFAGQSDDTVNQGKGEGPQIAGNRNLQRTALWKRLLSYSRWLWIGVVIADVGIQASKTAGDSADRVRILNNMELYFTLAFLVEIITRFMGCFPDYRAFSKSTSNLADTALAVITCVIQIPFIRASGVYPWLTAFQLMRFYRVILAVPRMKPLLAKLASSIAGLVNMVLFLLLMNFLVAVVAVQYLRGDIPAEDDGQATEYSFYQIYNSFISIYVVFSSEGWTSILYNAMQFEKTGIQAFISAVFISGWFLFANFILLQLFIAVINEGFAIAEEEKQKAQMTAYMKRYEPQQPVSWVSRWNPYRYFSKRDGEREAKAALPLRQRSAQTSSYSDSMSLRKPYPAYTGHNRASESTSSIFASVHRAMKRQGESTSMLPSMSAASLQNAEVDKELELLKYGLNGKGGGPDDLEEERQARQAEFIAAHPSYDRSLWIFSHSNVLRKVCQRLVEPAHGKRLYGSEPNHSWTAAFRLIILGAIVGSVVIASVATPAYRREYYIENQHIRFTWFNLTEVSLGFIFIIEFFIKIIADGFAFAPNAYLLSIWNLLDFFVLLTLIVSIGTSLSTGSAAVNSFTRSLKAFRALRLINLSSTMRETFYSVLIVGASKILDASVLTILYIIPFSIWGQNLFAGLLFSCNDDSMLGKTQCVGEYMASPLQWEFLAPRAWQNPHVWSFDSFRSALLILFEIVSLEGWSDVLQSAMSITGRDQQRETDASQYNGIFFLIYNLIGAIVVLTLFVSVIIENFTQRSGQALLTAEQRQWVDLKKLILRQRPAKMPKQRPHGAFRQWCYDRAIAKHGWWSKFLTTLYLFHVAVLMTQAFSQPVWVDDLRDYIFLLLTLIYAFDVVVRLSGLGMRSFAQNGWNMYDCFVVLGTFSTTIPLLLSITSQTATQLQKLFLVCIAFKLVQKNDSLNTLFKTAIASLPAIVNVFGLWLTLFLVWAIFYLEIFSLTRWSVSETWTLNFSTFPKTMLMLSLMSTGEAWNTYMHDYTLADPLCSPSESYLFDDCGSPAWAFVLFIGWNMLSMYIFLNMLTGVVVENFSFVFSLFGRVTSVSRDDMRQFKKTWAHYDHSRSGYIDRTNLVPFLKRLTGVFDISIYPPEFRVENLKSIALNTHSAAFMGGRMVDGLNIPALHAALAHMDPVEITQRKRLFNRIYYGALLTEDPVKGIAFTSVLLAIAHHKLIDINKSLKLEDLMLEKAKSERVNDLLDLDRIKGLLQMFYWRRLFLLERPASSHSNTDLPAIVLDDSGTDSPQKASLSIDTSVAGPILLDRSLESPMLSPRSVTGRSPSRTSSPQRRASDDGPRSPLLADDSIWVKVMEDEVAKAQTGQM